MTPQMTPELWQYAAERAEALELDIEGYLKMLVVADQQRANPDPPRQHPNPGRKRELAGPTWLK